MVCHFIQIVSNEMNFNPGPAEPRYALYMQMV